MENKLPKYWVVKQETDNPNWEKVIDYINNTYNMSWLGALTNYYYGYTGHSKHNGTDSGICLSLFKNNPTVLTIEAFMELTNQKSETIVTIKREQLQEIHDIACDTWKQIITNIASGQPFGDIELSKSLVDEMFKAATPIQLPVLVNIFGKQREELDLRVALDVKVDGLSLFGGLETSHTEAFIVLPSPFSKEDRNKFYLNPNYNWELVDDELIVTRK